MINKLRIWPYFLWSIIELVTRVYVHHVLTDVNVEVKMSAVYHRSLSSTLMIMIQRREVYKRLSKRHRLTVVTSHCLHLSCWWWWWWLNELPLTWHRVLRLQGHVTLKEESCSSTSGVDCPSQNSKKLSLQSTYIHNLYCIFLTCFCCI